MSAITFSFQNDPFQNRSVSDNVCFSTARLRAYMVLRQWMLKTFDMIEVSPGWLYEEICLIVTYRDNNKEATKGYGLIKCKSVEFKNVSYVKSL